MDTTPKKIEERRCIEEKLTAKIQAMEQYLVEADDKIGVLQAKIETLRVEKIRVNDVLAVLIELRGDNEGVSPIEDQPEEPLQPAKKKTKKSQAKSALKNARKALEIGDRVKGTLQQSAEEVLRSKSGQFMTLAGISLELCGDSENQGLREQLSAILRVASESGTIKGLERQKDGQRVLYRIAS
jgi:hypothetical protein